MSSRNVYLSPDERQKAPRIFRALDTAVQLYRDKGIRSRSKLLDATREVLAQEPAFQLQYLSLIDNVTAEETSEDGLRPDHGAVLSLALKLGNTRLIDVVLLPAVHGTAGHGHA
jgi:pantoate--beta-alanine ligase